MWFCEWFHFILSSNVTISKQFVKHMQNGWLLFPWAALNSWLFETALIGTHKDELREQPLIITDLHLICMISGYGRLIVIACIFRSSTGLPHLMQIIDSLYCRRIVHPLIINTIFSLSDGGRSRWRIVDHCLSIPFKNYTDVLCSLRIVLMTGVSCCGHNSGTAHISAHSSYTCCSTRAFSCKNPCLWSDTSINPDIQLLHWFFTLSPVFYYILWEINLISCQWYTLPSLFPEAECEIRSQLLMCSVISIPPPHLKSWGNWHSVFKHSVGAIKTPRYSIFSNLIHRVYWIFT